MFSLNCLVRCPPNQGLYPDCLDYWDVDSMTLDKALPSPGLNFPIGTMSEWNQRFSVVASTSGKGWVSLPNEHFNEYLQHSFPWTTLVSPIYKRKNLALSSYGLRTHNCSSLIKFFEYLFEEKKKTEKKKKKAIKSWRKREKERVPGKFVCSSLKSRSQGTMAASSCPFHLILLQPPCSLASLSLTGYLKRRLYFHSNSPFIDCPTWKAT